MFCQWSPLLLLGLAVHWLCWGLSNHLAWDDPWFCPNYLHDRTILDCVAFEPRSCGQKQFHSVINEATLWSVEPCVKCSRQREDGIATKNGRLCRQIECHCIILAMSYRPCASLPPPLSPLFSSETSEAVRKSNGLKTCLAISDLMDLSIWTLCEKAMASCFSRM